MELIDKKALVDDVMDNPIEVAILDGNTVVGVKRIWGEYLEPRINAQPTIDALPTVHGKWINQNRFHSELLAENDEIIVEEQCDKCKLWNVRLDRVNRPNYCPHCGARMDGDKE